MQTIKKNIPILIPLITGAIIRILFLSRQLFWYDEAASIFVAQKPWGEILFLTARDTHPPFYFLLLKTVTVFTSDILWLRLLSLVIGLASLPLMFNIGEKLVNKKTAYTAFLLLAFSPLHIYYSIQIRMYALVILEGLISCWLFVKLMRMPRPKTGVFFTGILLLSLYTHYSTLLLFFAYIFFLLFKQRTLLPNVYTYGIRSIVSSLVLFLPWLVYAGSKNSNVCWCFYSLSGFSVFISSLAINGLGLITIKDLVSAAPFVILCILGLHVTYFFWLFIRGTLYSFKEYNLLIFLAIIPLALTTLAGMFLPVFSPRALIIFFPIYLLLIARGLLTISSRHLRSIATIMSIAFTVLTLFIELYHPVFQNVPLKKESLVNKQNIMKELQTLFYGQ